MWGEIYPKLTYRPSRLANGPVCGEANMVQASPEPRAAASEEPKARSEIWFWYTQYSVRMSRRGYCEHRMRKTVCKKCPKNKRTYRRCPHLIRKDVCRVCNPKSICPHNILEQNCIQCRPQLGCVHKTRRSSCLLCNPKLTCEHGRREVNCKTLNMLSSILSFLNTEASCAK